MVPISALWLPILLSAIGVFLASYVAHMLLTHHRKDYLPIPNAETIVTPMVSPIPC